MRAAHIAEIETPKGVLLNGLWFGIHKPHTVYIWIHGLTGSAWSGRHIIELLAKNKAAGLTFNTRGYGHINTVKRKKGKETMYEDGGTAFERFSDCVDDIEGAVRLARSTGARNVFLIGHSTGCQKAVYWASKGGRGVKGIVLLGPLSDFADTLVAKKRKHYTAGLQAARALVRAKKGDELMPKKFTDYLFLTANRFLSLYTPDSEEEIFTYSQPKKTPTTLKKTRMPLLVMFASEDEFGDRPAEEIASWFIENVKEGDRVAVVPGTNHGFKGAEKKVVSTIKRFVSDFS